MTIWLRADGANYGETIAFNNLEKLVTDGVISGTTDWVERSIVIDIPEAAKTLHFGFYLRGSGTGSAADFSLNRVSDSVPLTMSSDGLASEPKNLNLVQ